MVVSLRLTRQSLFLPNVVAVRLKQQVSFLKVKVLVIDAPVQVEREPADVEIVVPFVEDLFSCNVVHDAVSLLGGRRDVVMVVQRVCLERGACRIGAGPDHQFGALIGQPPPDFRKVDVKADRHADPAEISLVNRHVLTDGDRRLYVVL
jgi:hypothetical protein